MSLKSLQSWVKDCGIANEIPFSTYYAKIKEAVRIAGQLQAELEGSQSETKLWKMRLDEAADSIAEYEQLQAEKEGSMGEK